MIKEWSDEAWEEFLEQVKKDRNFLKRIDNYNRIAYKIENNILKIAQCGLHYNE